jgi:hypothetical protein
MSSHVKKRKYYEDLYDLFTIKDSLLYRKSVKKGCKEVEIGKRKVQISVEGAEKFILYFVTGDRYKNRETVINKWMDSAREKDDLLKNTPFPSDIKCQNCGKELHEDSRYLNNLETKNIRVKFFARCKSCKKGLFVFDNGETYTPEPIRCPKCNSILQVKSTFKDQVSTLKETCRNCKYEKTDIINFKKEDLQREKETQKDKELLTKYREEFCLSEKEGQEYIKAIENVKQLNEMIKDHQTKSTDPNYQKVKKIKKLSSFEVQKLLQKELKKEGYINLKFDTPDISRFVAVPFTVQDKNVKRKVKESKKCLRKAIITILENTNWRLMSDGVRYRMGYLTGRLRGYESDEEMVKLIKKRDNKKMV